MISLSIIITKQPPSVSFVGKNNQLKLFCWWQVYFYSQLMFETLFSTEIVINPLLHSVASEQHLKKTQKKKLNYYGNVLWQYWVILYLSIIKNRKFMAVCVYQRLNFKSYFETYLILNLVLLILTYYLIRMKFYYY